MGIRSEIESKFDFEVVDEFLDHFGMMVDSMELLVLDLSKEELYRRSVEELFRIFHNIKSASGFLQLRRVEKLASFVENIFEELRQKDGPANDETINWLLQISDQFSKWQDDLTSDDSLTPIPFSLLKIPDLG